MLHQAELLILGIWVASNNVVLGAEQGMSGACNAVVVLFEKSCGMGTMLEDDTHSTILWIVDYG